MERVHVERMRLVRLLRSLFLVLAFALGTILPVPHTGMAHEMSGYTVEVAPVGDCDHCDQDAAGRVSCPKAFCTGSAIVLVGAEQLPTVTVAKPRPSRDHTRSGLLRSLDPPPPRTLLIG